MKKLITAVIGIMLFVAGHHYTRRQTEYMNTQKAQSDLTGRTTYAEKTIAAPANLKNTVAFRLVKPS